MPFRATMICESLVIPLAMISSMAASAASTLPAWIMQYGALGLCAYMVWRAERHRASLIVVIGEQQKELAAVRDQFVKIVQENTESNRQLRSALHDRPCLVDDGRVRT